MKIYSKSLDRVTPAERKILNSLTLRGESLMREDVLQRRNNLDQVQVFLAKKDGKIVGWSCVYPKRQNRCNIYTYVAYAQRRQGFGKRLLKKGIAFAKSKMLDVTVYPWDKRSEGFFSAVGAQKYAW